MGLEKTVSLPKSKKLYQFLLLFDFLKNWKKLFSHNLLCVHVFVQYIPFALIPSKNNIMATINEAADEDVDHDDDDDIVQ